MAEDKLIDMINTNIQNLRIDIIARLNRLEIKVDELVSKEDCKKNRESCKIMLSQETKEVSVRRVTAIGGVITGTITASAAAVVMILKLFLK